MELKKNLRNNNIFYYIIVVMVCFLLGYFLLASLDKIINPTIEQLYISIYTVYTQFGMIIFPVFILQTFSNDYKNKNILFYQLVGYNWLKYFLAKVVLNYFLISLPSIVGLGIIAAWYKDFTNLWVIVFYFESVICFQVLLECMWGFLFKNMIIGYVVNFTYWLFSIIFATASKYLENFARYDAANTVYKNLSEYLVTHDKKYLSISGNCIYTFGMFGIVLLVVFIGKGRWKKNGV